MAGRSSLRHFSSASWAAPLMALPAMNVMRDADELHPGSPIHIHAIAIGDAELSEAARAQLTRHFAVGRTGSWRVDAYDRQGRRVGTSLEDRRLLVLGGWGEPPPATRVP